MFKLAAIVFLTGTMAYSCFGSEISENFTGLTSQVAGEGSGIFNVAGNSPVYGTFTFNPADFTPDPVAPAGSPNLDIFFGGTDSVKMRLRDAGGTVIVDAQSSFLEISSLSNIAWALVAGSGSLSFSLVVQVPEPFEFQPGTSLFDLPQFGESALSGLLSSSSDSLGFNIATVSVAPEPPGTPLVAVGAGILLFCRRLRADASSTGE